MSVRLGGVLMRLHRMLMGGHMIAFCMVLGRCVVCLCCVLVMFRCFFVRFVCHKSPFVGTSALIASANLRVAPFRLRLCRIKISRKWLDYHSINIPIAGAGVGMGGNAHAANEFIVIEGAGKVYGYAGMEKMMAATLFEYAGLNK